MTSTPPTDNVRACARALLDELGIELVRLGRIEGRQTCALGIIEKMITRHGEGHARLVLMTIADTEGNDGLLDHPTIEGVSRTIFAHPDWTERGWLEAFDALDLAYLRKVVRANIKAAPAGRAMAALIFDRLTPTFDPPPPPKSRKPYKPRKHRPPVSGTDAGPSVP